MNAPETLLRESVPDHVILDVEGSRDVGPTEAAGLIRECIAHAHRRLGLAIARALDDLVECPPERADGRRESIESTPSEIARVVSDERGKFARRFRSEFDRLFEARRDGKPRERAQRGVRPATLALVEERELAGQVALKRAVQAMRAAARSDGFGFDLRVRLVMREQPVEGEYENPWGAELVCDALGNTCRSLWSTDNLWRPIMMHLVVALTPELIALRRELDALLQDRDILPELHVRTRKRVASGTPTREGDGGLFDQVVKRLTRSRSGRAIDSEAPDVEAEASSANLPRSGQSLHGNGGRTATGDALVLPSWAALLRALTLLEQGQAGVAAMAAVSPADLAALRDGTASRLRALTPSASVENETDPRRAALEILSAVMDEVFDSPFLPPEIKTVFGRLQIPLLKATLLDPALLSQRRHVVRRFFDTLGAASVGLRPDHGRDGLFIQLAGHLASNLRAESTEGLASFETAHQELAAFLDADRAAYNQELVKAVPSLIALDAHAAALASARAAIAMRVAARPVPPEVGDYLEQEGLRRATMAYLEDGPDGPAWSGVLRGIDDLVWSVAHERSPDARRRLVTLIPRLVREIDAGWPTDDATPTRREAFLSRLCELHVEALSPRPAIAGAAILAPTAGRKGIVPAPPSTPSSALLEDAGIEDALMRGDWCIFRGDDDASLIAKFAWRAPHGTQLLFTHRDGTIAVIHTPSSLARAFESGRASVAIESVPLFERAMERVIERYDETARPYVPVAREQVYS